MSYPTNDFLKNLTERVNALESAKQAPPQRGPYTRRGIVKTIHTSGTYGYLEVQPLFNKSNALPLYIANSSSDDGALVFWNNSGNFQNSLDTYNSSSDQQYVRVYVDNMPSKYWGGFFQTGDIISFWEAWVPATNTFSNQVVVPAYITSAREWFWAEITDATAITSLAWSYDWVMMQPTSDGIALVSGGWTSASTDGDVALNSMETNSTTNGINPSGISLPLYTGCPLHIKPIGPAIVPMYWGRDETGDTVFNFCMPNVVD